MALIQPYQNVQQVSFQFWAKPVLQASDGTYYSPGFDGPTYASSPWDYLYLGVPSTQPFTPGLCTVAVNRTRDVDKKKAVGNDGARVTIHGVDAAMVEIAIRIWTPEQLRQLAALWPTLFPNAYKGAPPAYDVQRPTHLVELAVKVEILAVSAVPAERLLRRLLPLALSIRWKRF
jgi:hypothetical protein